MRLLSGDQDGAASSTLLRVRRRTLPPLIATTLISRLWLRRESRSNTMLRPSRDTDGLLSSPALPRVTRTGFLPRASIVQSWLLPVRVLAKTILPLRPGNEAAAVAAAPPANITAATPAHAFLENCDTGAPPCIAISGPATRAVRALFRSDPEL
jgi:hypothetical protein